MRHIPLSQGKFAIIDEADFPEISSYKWYFHQGRAVRKPKTIDKKRTGFIWMHREIAKPDDDKVIDHINGNTLDNRRENLRICTRSQNQWNKSPRIKSFTRMKNIHWKKEKKRYAVRFQKFGKKIEFGYFKNLEEAIKVRNDAVLSVHEGFNPPVQVSTSA